MKKAGEQPGEVLLSICLIGRNDDYGMKFKKRLELAINYLALNAKKLNLLFDLEIVLVDWGSPDVPLHEVLTLSEPAVSITRIIQVSPEIAEKHNYKDSGFNHVVPSNLGLRRASGKYLAMMPADILISAFVLERIFQLLNHKLDVCFNPEKAILAAPRKLIPSTFEDDIYKDSPGKLDKFFLYNDWFLRNEKPQPGILGAYGLMIFDREVFTSLRGWNEKLGGWGLQDSEFGIRGNCHYPMINLSFLGIFVYDFEPDMKCYKEKFDRTNSVDKVPEEVNDENWGLNDIEFEEINLKFSPQKHSSIDIKNDMTYVEDLPSLLIKCEFRKFAVNNFFNIDNYCLATMLLAKFSLCRKPLKYLEIGMPQNCSKVISLINPLAELYIAPSADEKQGNYENDYNYFMRTSKYSRHLGAIRYIPGNPETCMDRLKKSFIGAMSFDQILLHVSRGTDISFVNELVEYLSDKGILLLSFADCKDLPKIREYHFSDFTVVRNEKHKFIVIIKGVEDCDKTDINRLVFGKWFCFLSESAFIKTSFSLAWLIHKLLILWKINGLTGFVKLFYKIKKFR